MTGTHADADTADTLVDGHGGFFEGEVTPVIVIKNSDSSSSVLANFEFSSNASSSLESTSSIDNSINSSYSWSRGNSSIIKRKLIYLRLESIMRKCSSSSKTSSSIIGTVTVWLVSPG